jgi:hypothetical protein
MPSTEIDRRVRAVDAAASRNDKLIERAAKRTGLAGAALAGAAGDLGNAWGRDGNALTGLAEILLHDAQRLSHLQEDIESHRTVPVAAQLADLPAEPTALDTIRQASLPK